MPHPYSLAGEDAARAIARARRMSAPASPADRLLRAYAARMNAAERARANGASEVATYEYRVAGFIREAAREATT